MGFKEFSKTVIIAGDLCPSRMVNGSIEHKRVSNENRMGREERHCVESQARTSQSDRKEATVPIQKKQAELAVPKLCQRHNRMGEIGLADHMRHPMTNMPCPRDWIH